MGYILTDVPENGACRRLKKAVIGDVGLSLCMRTVPNHPDEVKGYRIKPEIVQVVTIGGDAYQGPKRGSIIDSRDLRDDDTHCLTLDPRTPDVSRQERGRGYQVNTRNGKRGSREGWTPPY